MWVTIHIFYYWIFLPPTPYWATHRVTPTLLPTPYYEPTYWE